jgi:porin
VDYKDLDRETWGTLTALNYTQFLSTKFGVYFGKLDLMDGDPNEFAGGRGDTQFMKYNFIFAAPTAVVPASTLGAGALFMPNENVTIASQLVSATDSSFDSFDEAEDDWSDGQIWATALMTQYRLDGLPGGFNATYLRWFNTELTDLDTIIGPTGALSGTKESSWVLALSAWQYLYTEEASEGPLSAANKIPDLQGWGPFARIGLADKDTNPFKFDVSLGIGGRGILPGRDNDMFGVGYFYSETEDDNVLTAVGIDDSTNGGEVFYNLAITPAARIAFDVQWLKADVPGADNALVLGTRFWLNF